ncbi:MAG: P-loop NTPase [Parasphingopyxis sp.]|uniref:P-loop NTPase n=1 Tax=Parasphingopyxis sp. TaxID=1920299 RepID=UPI003FA12C81
MEMNASTEELLLAQIKQGQVVLALGAGVNGGSTNRRNNAIADSGELANILCSEMGVQYGSESLSEVISAFESRLGRPAFEKIIIREFRYCKPSAFLEDIFKYPWMRIYTWNVDDAIAEATKKSVQRIQVYNGISDKVEDSPGLEHAQLVYLNGQSTNIQSGVIFSREDYARALHNSQHGWYRQAANDYMVSTVLFLGTSLNEPILETEIQRAVTGLYGSQGRSFLITPDQLTEIRIAALENRGVIHIRATFEDFIEWLKRKVGDSLSPRDIVDTGKYFDSESLSRFTSADLSAAQSIFPKQKRRLLSDFEQQPNHIKDRQAREYLNGFGPSWSLVSTEIPVRLNNGKNLSKKIAEAFEMGAPLFATIGQAGSGKTTATMQALVDLSDAEEFEVFEFAPETRSIAKALGILRRINDKPKLVFIPNLPVTGQSLAEDFAFAKEANAMFVSTARSSEWADRFVRYFGKDAITFEFQRFTKSDYEPLLARLRKYVPAPQFTKLSEKAQRAKLAKSKSQLLMALREATESRNFEEIIIDEFESLPNDSAKRLFIIAGIATLARSGISNGSAFEAFSAAPQLTGYENALNALSGIVRVDNDKRLYARHEFYVRHIFDTRVDLDIIFDIICDCLDVFTKYEIPVTRHVSKPDATLFRFLLNHSFLRERAESGRKREAGLKVYKKFEVQFQLDGHFWLQYGLYYRGLGQKDLAIEMLDKSIKAYPDNPFAIHALAQLQLIQAERMSSSDRRAESLIGAAVAALEKMAAEPLLKIDQYPLVTLANFHTAALMKHGKQGEARAMAQSYFNRLSKLENEVSSPEVVSAKSRMLKYASTGTWEHPGNQF